MTEHEIIHIALENLEINTGITGKWENYGNNEIDGRTKLIVENQIISFNTEIKQELRNHQLPKILDQAERFGPLMVVANRIFPAIKQELRQHNIAYLETNGNIWLRDQGVLIWIDTNKPLKEIKDKGNRAFTKTGLKVIFQFLLDNDTVNMPYREIASRTEVGLGNINYVMNGLKEMGFLVKLNKTQNNLTNKKELLQKWMGAYAEKLKPSIAIGTFRFLREEDFANWKNIQFKDPDTRWGGEPAGDLLTNYLHPAELTIYTNETRNDLIKNYRLIPDENGNVKAYKKYWQYDENNDNIVPALLAYADLMNTNDRRCTETAKKIYDELIQGKI